MRVTHAHEPVRHPARLKLRIPNTLEITSMFKKLVPVIALALIAGPVFAADPPATGSTATAPAKSSSHKKHHSSSHKSKKSATTDSSAPK